MNEAKKKSIASVAYRRTQPRDSISASQTRRIREEVVVSEINGVVLSRLGDNHWDLSHDSLYASLTKGAMSINFSISLPDGSFLTDPQHDSIKHATQCALAIALLTPSESLGRRRKARTVYNTIWHSFRMLLKWMNQNGLSEFSLLSPAQCSAYLEYLRSLPRLKDADGSPVRHRVALASIAIDLLWKYRNELPDAIRSRPWPSSVMSPQWRKIKYVSAATPVIPDFVCKQLLQEALQTVESRSKRILRASADLERASSTSLPKSTRERATTKLMRAHGYLNVHQVNADRLRLMNACIVTIMFFSGIRVSELLGLKISCLQTKKANGTKYYWLEGHVFKRRDRPHPARWQVPQPVATAVHVVKALTKAFRITPKMSDSQDLSKLLFIWRSKRALGTKAITAPWVTQSILNYATQCELRDSDGCFWRLSPTQFRRTFAHFMARHSLGDLTYLSKHFQHMSLEQTAYYGEGGMHDASTNDSFLEARRELQEALVGEWLKPETRLAGGAGAAVMTWRSRQDVRTYQDMASLSAALSDGVRIRGTGHSYCLASGDDCGGYGLYDAIRCSSCRSSVIGESHRATWETLKAQQIEVLRIDGLGAGTKRRCQEQLEACQQVLAELDGLT